MRDNRNADLDMDIAIIGAGIIGLSCGFRLVQAGQRVMLIERGDPGRGCSYGNAGHIATEQIFPLASASTLLGAPRYLLERDAPLAIRGAYLWRIAPWLMRFAWAARPAVFRRGMAALQCLQARALDAIESLLRDASAGELLYKRGHISLIERASSIQSARREIGRCQAHGIHAEWLSPIEAGQLAPAARRDIAGAIFYRDSGHVADPYAVCQALRDAFVAAGGDILRGTVREIVPVETGFHITGEAVDHKVKKLVIAAGAWSKPLAAQLGHNLPLDTERGYHLTLNRAGVDFDLPVASFERKVIITPMRPGLRICGGVEFGGLTLPATQSRYTALSRHFNALAPHANPDGGTPWMGFRPTLPDYLPVIGQSAHHRGAFFAFGHQHLGLTLSGVTADLVCHMVQGRSPGLDLSPYAADRFTITTDHIKRPTRV